MQLRILLIALAVVLSSCAHKLPKPPQGELCTHYKKSDVAVCNDISTGNHLPDVPIELTDKWIMFSPKTWESVMNYIDALKRKISDQSVSTQAASNSVRVTANDIAKFKKFLVNLKQLNQNNRAMY